MFNQVDHIAIVVRDTDQALTLYRDTLNLPLLFSEELPGPGVRLTHLDMGNVQLQLVQPLIDSHPLQDFLDKHGEGLHHLCWKVDNIDSAMTELSKHQLQARPNEPHDAPNGGRAAFIEPTATHGVLFEMTGR